MASVPIRWDVGEVGVLAPEHAACGARDPEGPDRQYDVLSDGSRILVNRVSKEIAAIPMTVVP
jgi:hypothetical protein